MVKLYMMELGYKEEDINKILNHQSIKRILDKTLLLHIERIFYFFLDKGYTKEQIIQMTKHTPSLYSCSAESIEHKYKELLSLGYTKEDIIYITRIAPVIFTYNSEKIKEKMNLMIKLGYTKQEVLKMTVKFPGIYSASKDKIIDKIKYFQKINLDKIFLKDAKQLIQSIELTHARYEFLKEQTIEINDKNYKTLFYEENQFKNKFKISKEELLEKYNYEEYLERKEKSKTI